MTSEPRPSDFAQPAAQPDSVAAALNRLNDPEKRAQAKEALAVGQAMFGRGRYREAIDAFKLARSLSNPMSASGGRNSNVASQCLCRSR